MLSFDDSDDLEAAADDILELVNSGRLGRHLWQMAVYAVVAQRVSAKIQTSVDDLLTKATQITHKAIAQHKQKVCMHQVLSLTGSQLVPYDRQIAVKYHGGYIKNIKVSSINHELDIRTSAGLKTLARHTKLLAALPMEELCITPADEPSCKATIADDVLRPLTAVRGKTIVTPQQSTAVLSGGDVYSMLLAQD